MKTKFLIKALLTSLFFTMILFISAWKINYWQGFVFLGTNLITGFMNFWTIRNDVELMTERSKVGEGAKSWDKIILGVSGVTYLLSVIIAGLDLGRFNWSPDFHWSICFIGFILTIIGQLIFLTARKENKYFSSVVRIQTDREHAVCESGIYKIVRHPGYLGMTVSLIAMPLLTCSVWSYIPIIISIILLIVRTYLEDETLKKELNGYTEYAQKTRKRLFPMVW
jgi:protein-S-isoprenylcysteine O-methyltransferase Ste14